MQAPGIPENEEQRLKSLYITGLLDTRDDERFERLTRLARKAFQVPVALISLLDRERSGSSPARASACAKLHVIFRSADTPFCRKGLLSFTMRLPMRDFTIIPWLPVSHTSGSTPASR